MKKPQDTYENKIKFYQSKLQKLEKKSRQISNLRLFISLGGIGAVIYLYLTGNPFGAISIFVLTSALFITLVLRHQNLKQDKNISQAILKINEQSIARFSDSWTLFPDTGSEFIEESHPYAVDLDIFGKRSLFQLINTAHTFLGRQKLKNLLIAPTLDKISVITRQEIIKELADHLDFRQNLQSEGMQHLSINKNPEELVRWANSSHNRWTLPKMIFFMRLSPIVLFTFTILAVLMPKVIPFFIPLTIVLFHAILLFYSLKDTSATFAVASKYQESIKSFQQMLRLFEEENFTSPGLKKLQKALKNPKGQPAFRQIEKLRKVVDMTHLRYHQFYLIFDLFTLWDFHCMAALEQWKKESGKGLENWLHVLGEIEAYASSALLSYDHPEWCLPVFNNSSCKINAKELGHPLLPATRVTNDMTINHSGEILLITGSNMSGKSTFLRTIGINLVLAYIGAPVCAEDFQCSFFHIHTSMRINDNLDTGTSSFFAELVRIKTILGESKEGKPVLFLLDEIFKGTNSRDRHTGAKHLIKKLSSTGAIGLVSTHDLELGDLSKESPYIKNYHFAEYYQNGKIYFDYKLKPGVSTTRNAIFLMKMAGIDIDD
ncbi:MAG: DNA mismatch repair protein MutS [Dehalobacterium sp.]